MTSGSEDAEAVEKLLETPDLATALESEQFKKFLDQVPIAIAVSDLTASERVVYANPEFEKLSGLEAASLTRENWGALAGDGPSPPEGSIAGRRQLLRKPILSALSDWSGTPRSHRL